MSDEREKHYAAFIDIKMKRTIPIRAKNGEEAQKIAELELARLWKDRPPNPHCTMKQLPIADEIIFRVEESVDFVSCSENQDCNSQGPP